MRMGLLGSMQGPGNLSSGGKSLHAEYRIACDGHVDSSGYGISPGSTWPDLNSCWAISNTQDSGKNLIGTRF
jgi:hypothetical protein